MSVNLRPYQQDAIDATLNWIKTEKSYFGLVVLPTGGGKTIVGAAIAYNVVKQTKMRVIWACHREELKQQAIKALGLYFKEDEIQVWDADTKDYNKETPVTVIMIPSSRTFSVSPEEVRTIFTIYDEAHHISAGTWIELQLKILGSHSIGLTATPQPDRSFRIIYEISFSKLVDLGYLSKPTYVKVETKLEFNLQRKHGEFTTASFCQLATDDRNKIIWETWLKDKDKYTKSVFFCGNLVQAKKLQEYIQEKIDDAGLATKIFLLHGAMPKTYREAKLQESKESRDAIIININILTEGYDDPTIDAIFICRPTTSKTLYHQMVGRAARIADGKTAFHIVDFVDSIARYEFASKQFISEILSDTKTATAMQKALDTEDAIRDMAKKLKLKPAKLKDLAVGRSPIFTEIAAYIVGRSKFGRNIKVFVDKSDLEIILVTFYKIRELYNNGENVKNFISRSYGELGHTTDLGLKLWKDICWCIFNFIELNSNKDIDQTFKEIFHITFVEKPDPTTLPKYDVLSKIAREANDALNREWADKHQVLFEIIYDKIYNEASAGIAKAIVTYTHALRYQNRILTLQATPDCRRANYTDQTGCKPGIASLKIWKEYVRTYLRGAVQDETADVEFVFTN